MILTARPGQSYGNGMVEFRGSPKNVMKIVFERDRQLSVKG